MVKLLIRRKHDSKWDFRWGSDEHSDQIWSVHWCGLPAGLSTGLRYPYRWTKWIASIWKDLHRQWWVQFGAVLTGSQSHYVSRPEARQEETTLAETQNMKANIVVSHQSQDGTYLQFFKFQLSLNEAGLNVCIYIMFYYESINITMQSEFKKCCVQVSIILKLRY